MACIGAMRAMRWTPLMAVALWTPIVGREPGAAPAGKRQRRIRRARLVTSDFRLNRRASLSLLLGSAAGLASAPVGAATGETARRLANASPREQLRAFVKVFVSLEAETVWYWFTGLLHAARPDKPVVPFLACDTLIRRDVLPQADGSFGVRTFEANYYHPPDSQDPAVRITNPLNGRAIEPFHYREGPHVLVLSEGGSRWVAGTDVKPAPVADGKAQTQFAESWRQAGPVVWTTRETYTDRPHPLERTKWRLEASGTRMTFGSFANYFAPAAEVESRDVARTDCSFAYQALTGWWPWMLMGDVPGHVLWRANGRKLRSLDETPPESRAAFERLHPRLFATGFPWTTPASLWTDYPRERAPVQP
jgi:hypothetical protein